jgi:DNA invertase Pin-like site-specific DNA recombinase
VIEKPVKQEIYHCLRVFAKYALANVLDDSYIYHISRKKKSESGDRPTFRRLIAPISEGVSDMIHAKGDSGCVHDTLQIL